MNTSYFGLAGWSLFLLFYFFGTQRFYNHRSIPYTGGATIVLLSIIILVYRKILPDEKLYNILFLFIYYFALLLLIKWKYRAVNRLLVKIKWLKPALIHKKFTFVIGSDSGKDLWEDKLASPPSWFDHLLSTLLLLGPMLLLILTIKLLF
jgi:hypothetical protein